MPLVNIVGIFLEDGQVCTYYNFETHGKSFESGDVVQLPRRDKDATVVILGNHVNLAQATAAAAAYFKRLCKWDNVEDLSAVRLFGHDLAPIEEEVSQIGFLASQDQEGPLLSVSNCFDLMGQNSEQED